MADMAGGLISAQGRQDGEMLHLCSSRWDLPARHHRSPGSLHPAQAAVSRPGWAESHRHDHVALVCAGAGQTQNRSKDEKKKHNITPTNHN